MVYVANDKYNFYDYRCTFIKKENNKEKTIKYYTDNPGRIERMVMRNPETMSNFNSEPLKPSVEQFERLNEINGLNIENKESRVPDVNLYVEYGVMINNDGPFATIFDKSAEATKVYIIEQLKPFIKKSRDRLEYEGYEFMGKLFDCDAAARANMAGAAASMAGAALMDTPKEAILGSKITWKLFDNTYFEVTAGDVLRLGNEVKDYFSDSILAESLTIEELNKKTVTELLNIKDLEELRSIRRSSNEEQDILIHDIYKEVLNNYRKTKGL